MHIFFNSVNVAFAGISINFTSFFARLFAGFSDSLFSQSVPNSSFTSSTAKLYILFLLDGVSFFSSCFSAVEKSSNIGGADITTPSLAFMNLILLFFEVSSESQTTSHEMGHFFSLRHTFYGWECEPWNVNDHGQIVTFTIAPCFSARVS